MKESIEVNVSLNVANLDELKAKVHRIVELCKELDNMVEELEAFRPELETNLPIQKG